MDTDSLDGESQAILTKENFLRTFDKDGVNFSGWTSLVI